MADIFINQELFLLPETGRLADLLPLLEIHQPDGIAIAVNDNVIPREQWPVFLLQPKDRVFVIRATQGG